MISPFQNRLKIVGRLFLDPDQPPCARSNTASRESVRPRRFHSTCAGSIVIARDCTLGWCGESNDFSRNGSRHASSACVYSPCASATAGGSTLSCRLLLGPAFGCV